MIVQYPYSTAQYQYGTVPVPVQYNEPLEQLALEDAFLSPIIVLIWHHQTSICYQKWNKASKVYGSKLISYIKVVVKQRQCLQDVSFCPQGFEALTYHNHKCINRYGNCAQKHTSHVPTTDPCVTVTFLYTLKPCFQTCPHHCMAWPTLKHWNPNTHHCCHKNLDLDSIQNQSHMSIVSNSIIFHCSLYSSYPNWSCPAGLVNRTTLPFVWFFHFQSSLVPLGSDTFS